MIESLIQAATIAIYSQLAIAGILAIIFAIILIRMFRD